MPGRPPNATSKDIAGHLVRTVKDSLKDNSHIDLSVRQIAKDAGVHPNMVRYYFGSIDNLLASIVDETVEAADHQLSIVERSLSELDNPTRAIVQALTHAYYPDPRLSSIMLIESLRPQSKFMEHYHHRHRWRLFARLQTIVRSLIDLGIYRRDLDSLHATFTIQTLVAGPLAIGQLERADGLSEDLDLAAWETHVVDLLHGNFASPRPVERD